MPDPWISQSAVFGHLRFLTEREMDLLPIGIYCISPICIYCICPQQQQLIWTEAMWGRPITRVITCSTGEKSFSASLQIQIHIQIVVKLVHTKKPQVYNLIVNIFFKQISFALAAAVGWKMKTDHHFPSKCTHM